MFRFLLISYLTMSTALGPAFCCCQLGRILPGLNSSACCGQHGTSHSHDFIPQKQDHESHVGHCHHDDSASVLSGNHESTSSESADEQESRGPCESSCPCGRHDPVLVNGTFELSAVVVAGVLNFLQPIDQTPIVQAAFSNLAYLSASIEERTASLSGREILRAYQIWRC